MKDANILFLSSDKAGFITGENICIDGGMTRQMIYHGDNNWKLDVELYYSRNIDWYESIID